MSERFLSSDEYDEKAHQLYNEGRYDDALEVLKEGAGLYPNASELQVGMAYAYLAREEYAWARRHFEAALTLDVDHEDALAGYGEVLLKLGDEPAAIRSYERILELGFQDDHELMLQLGRALFREGYIGHAHRFFGFGVAAHPDSAEATACVGYASHRMGRDAIALYWLRRALELFRNRTAKKLSWKPYMVLHKKVIVQLDENRPKSLEQLHEIDGMGPAKVDRFGWDLLDIVRRYDS